ncbi:MAG: hypothetical protein QM679_06370 [Patulibacter sp.]
MSTAEPETRSITTAWPVGFPADAKGVVRFAIREVAAPADAVYRWLLRPDLHAQYYGALRGVRRVSGAWPVIEVGTRLSFLLGPIFVPQVKVAQADPTLRSMAWIGGVPGLKICHAFTVKALDEQHSLLRSEEAWVGAVARLLAPAVAGQLQAVQTDWCAAVVRAATAHPAGPPAA